MIETAIEIAGKRSDHYIISEIIRAGQELLSHPIEPLPQVRETLEYLSASYQTILITRGDLFDQERKLANSGLAEAFDAIEIVSDKDVNTYSRIFSRYEGGPACAAMVGNSLRSDILPAIEAGSWGLYIPHHIVWSVEHAEPPNGATRFRQLRQFADLPAALAEIEQMDGSEPDRV
jgi:putative hydrolase of the HAD superfamily